MRRNLVEQRITEEKAARIEQAMRGVFEEAEVDAAEIDLLEPAMTDDEKDRHVPAAAVAADSELLKRVCHASPTPSARGASLAWRSLTRHQQERTTDAQRTRGRRSLVATVDYNYGFPWG
jgi:hypothetical protein